MSAAMSYEEELLRRLSARADELGKRMVLRRGGRGVYYGYFGSPQLESNGDVCWGESAEHVLRLLADDWLNPRSRSMRSTSV